MCAARHLPAHRIGVVDSGLGGDVGLDPATQVLAFSDEVTVSLDELRMAHEQTLPAALA
jgi:hypothetical protein